MPPEMLLSLDEVHHRYGEEVHAYLRRRLDSPEDAEDLAQEAFLRVARSGRVEELENPRAYLLRTAKNLLRDRFRRDSLAVFDTGREVTDEGFAHPAPSPERTAGARQELEALAHAMAGLSPKVRQALILHKFHHYSYKRVAAIMGISPKTVEKHLAKAIAGCRRELRQQGSPRAENVIEFSNTEPQRASDAS